MRRITFIGAILIVAFSVTICGQGKKSTLRSYGTVTGTKEYLAGK